MKHKTGIRVQATLLFGLIAWIAICAVAAYLIDGGGGQVGILIGTLGLLGFTAGLVFFELRAARIASGIQVEYAQQIVDTWPHVINMLDDLERIDPERAEMIQVVRLDMEQHLESARRTAEGRSLTPRELLSQLRSKR